MIGASSLKTVHGKTFDMAEPSTTNYALIDCGAGRRLERFGDVIVDRPAPVAMWSKALPSSSWRSDLYFDHVRTGADRPSRNGSDLSSQQQAAWKGTPPQDWRASFGPVVFGVQTLAGGQLGVFPEQQESWRWITQVLPALVASSRARKPDGQPLRILNLFAYTGGSTLAAASVEGVELCHLDAAKPSVEMAKHNALLSGLQERPVRWMVDDTMAFVERELRRGKSYDGVILDPPAFGRGKGGKVWKLSQHLPKLLAALSELLSPEPALVLLSAHDPKFGRPLMKKAVESLLGRRQGKSLVETGELTLRAAHGSGNDLPLGEYARWSASVESYG